MIDDATARAFDAIYATDLIYAPGCWQLCGDAHCCNFTRYKSRMHLVGRRHKQELPLLPGEYEYLRARNLVSDFGAAELHVVEYPLAGGFLRLETLVGQTDACACKHATRTTVCRLYPLLPVYEPDGTLIGVDPNFGIFEEIEAVEGSERACRLTSVPFGELDKFLAIAAAIGRNPRLLFYAMAYRTAKLHARDRLRQVRAEPGGGPNRNALALFEGLFLLRRLFDHAALRPQLEDLAARFRQHYGGRFSLD